MRESSKDQIIMSRGVDEESRCIEFFKDELFERKTKNVITVIFAVLCLLIVIFNLVVISGVLRAKLSKKPLTVTRKLLLILFIAQLVSAIILLPYQMIMINRAGNCGGRAGFSFVYNFMVIFLLNVVVILGLERQVLIIHRKKHRKDFSHRRIRLYAFIAIAVTLAWSIAHALVTNQNNKKKLAAFYMAQTVYILLLLIFIFITTLKISHRVQLSKRNFSLNIHNKRTERKLTKAIIVISNLLAISYIPIIFSMVFISHHFHTDGKIDRSLELVIWCGLSVFLNHAISPIVYLILDKKARSYYSRDSTRSNQSLRKKSLQHQRKISQQQQRKISQQSNFGSVNFIPSRNSMAGPIRQMSTESSGSKTSEGGRRMVKQISFDTGGRKFSEGGRKNTASYKDMKKKVSVVSTTMEVKNGQLVLKDAEKKSRKISRQQHVNMSYQED